ncbi:hypothetical protein NQ317_014771 [Molorchus minor]|uniref:Olfactomedin-like domain-containing protein n=1 Tax=Molorchus minor TaxID=1323400 RepID=A0ABQ9J8F3_9CUCU|nr:hypothetical protein NQ317_014771 [Molorchus minor]
MNASSAAENSKFLLPDPPVVGLCCAGASAGPDKLILPELIVSSRGTYTKYYSSIECVLYAVGKPVYHRFTDYTYGAWMRDSASLSNETEHNKYWVTHEDKTNVLYEYDNKTMFRQDKPNKEYALNQSFWGNSHVIYKGCFFYNQKNTNRILKFFLEVPAKYSDLARLYSGKYNYMDFSVDDNGLWVIFAVPHTNNTAVMKNKIVRITPYAMNSRVSDKGKEDFR